MAKEIDEMMARLETDARKRLADGVEATMSWIKEEAAQKLADTKARLDFMSKYGALLSDEVSLIAVRDLMLKESTNVYGADIETTEGGGRRIIFEGSRDEHELQPGKYRVVFVIIRQK